MELCGNSGLAVRVPPDMTPSFSTVKMLERFSTNTDTLGYGRRVWSAVCLAAVALGCGDATSSGGGGSGNRPGGGGQPTGFNVACDLPPDFVFDGGTARDAIPALVNPTLVAADHPDAGYLDAYALAKQEQPKLPDARVVGLVIEGQPVAVPHNILWWHEIVHLDVGLRRFAITYCPLTGSTLVFDASAVPTERFGVSGLVFMNNLMMFDPETESLWPQMARGARCGPRSGAALVTVPHIEMRWEAWKELHPETAVVSSATGLSRDYAAYPYDLYEAADWFLLFPMPELDRRRGGKERVLGIPDRDGGLAFPFGALGDRGSLAVVDEEVGGRRIVVLWSSAGQAAQAFEPRTESGAATLSVVAGQFVDRESGSTWTVEGVAVTGPREGERLLPARDAFVAFWFAWAAFHPETEIWQ